MAKPLFYVHGLDSSPQGFRATFFKKHFPSIQIPALPNDVTQRLAIVKQNLQEPSYFVGSSLGGLTTALLARDVPSLIAGMVLIAPAVDSYDRSLWKPEHLTEVSKLVLSANIPTHIIAAKQDEVIPYEAIARFRERAEAPEAIPFEVFDDNHLLHTHRALCAQLRAIERLTGLQSQDPAFFEM